MPEYPYARSYRPPAPVLPVGVRRPGTPALIYVAALVDTGAALTALPATLPAQLQLPSAGGTIVAGFDGTPRIVPTYIVEIEVAGRTVVLKAIGLGRTALLGRDALNVMVLTLRGPDAITLVEAPRA